MSLTFGIEEELQVVDPRTGEAVGAADDVLAALDVRGFEAGQLDSEIHATMLETSTTICTSLADARTQLERLRAALRTAARSVEYDVLAAASPPLRAVQHPRVRDTARFAEIEDLHAGIVSGMSTCGTHVHVGMDDRDMSVAVSNRVRQWLPALLALSANSPFWDGRDTGYGSYRTVIWARWPSATMPETFADAAEYDAVVDAMIRSGAILDEKQVYFDVRPSRDHPTLEFRIADVGLAVEDTLLHAALCIALAETARREVLAGAPEPFHRPEMLRAAKWRAARFGMSGDLLDLSMMRLVPAREHVERLVEHLDDVLQERGERELVDALLRSVLEHGTGADRQRAAQAATGDLAAVVPQLLRGA